MPAMLRSSLTTLLLLVGFSLPLLAASAKSSYRVFIGAYTEGHSKGIYTFQFDPATGKANTPELAVETQNPSFLAVDPTHKFLYAVNETHDYQGSKSGAVSVFSIDPTTWKLKLLQQVSSLGGDPSYITVDRTGRALLVANYTGGNVAVFPIGKDGRLGEHTALDQHTGASANHERQEAAHAHSIQMTPDNRFAVSADLGNDKVILNRFDPAGGTLTPNQPPSFAVDPGSGPRHVAFAASGKFVYVLNELTTSVTVFSFDPRTGAAHALQTIDTVDKHDPQNTAAEIAIDAPGRFLYTSTRHDDSLAVFKIAQDTGRLTLVERTPSIAKTPRFFTLDPTGQWMLVAGQDSNDIVLFRVDKNTGKLTPSGDRIEVGAPVDLVFIPSK
jgi:6-phosphogluconolactonase